MEWLRNAEFEKEIVKQCISKLENDHPGRTKGEELYYLRGVFDCLLIIKEKMINQ